MTFDTFIKRLYEVKNISRMKMDIVTLSMISFTIQP